MSLERSDAIRIAKALAAKLSAEPEKYAKIISAIPELDDSASCGPMYGPTPAPGDAVKALAAMHDVVNGMRQSGTNKPDPKSITDCSSFGDNCIMLGAFNPCSCTLDNGFHGITGPCVAPDMFTCGTPADPRVYKCQSGFTCGPVHSFGGCTGRFCQCDDGSCPNQQTDFNCPKFTCSGIEGGDHFNCKQPGQHGSFACLSSESEYYCAVNYLCDGASFHCQSSKFICEGQFVCENGDIYYCDNRFICEAGQAFTCGGNPFKCGLEEGDTFQCMPIPEFGPSQCEDVFQCVPSEAYLH